MRHMRFPLRLKLAILSLVPLIAAVILCSIVGISIINSRVVTQAQDRVRTALNSAREVYQRETSRIRDVIRFSAGTPLAAQVIASKNRAAVASILNPLMAAEGLDIITAVDEKGTVIFRAHARESYGDSRAESPLVIPSLQGRIVSGTMIMSPAELAAEGKDLADRAALELVATPRARPSADTTERRGMMLVAAAPVRDADNKVVGAIYGGILLNQNNTLVDRIKQIVYEGVKFEGEDIGTATIFLGDTRIATNVLTREGKRAIGTRQSQEVYDRVSTGKEKWLGRAFVVNGWYFSAYEPITDIRGNTVGSLFVGMLERPYSALKQNITLIFAGVLLVGTLMGAILTSVLSSRLAHPIKEFEELARRVATGERGLTITVNSRDEIGDLAAEFNQMTSALTEREEEIRELNRNLEQKVQERTTELEEKNRLLIKTREELVQAGKLADLGVLAAGVAHEINNPMAIIRGNAELLHMSVPSDSESSEEVETIIEQVGRVERIVSNLLIFARQGKKQLGHIAVNMLLDDILDQIGHQVPLTGIEIRKFFQKELPDIEGDQGKLRQVFTNLLVNAVQAMEQGGILSLTTALHGDSEVMEITIADTGIGIDHKLMDKVFSPFFTTKPSGTGLGLSVSYGIIKEHNGTIDAHSKPGQGTVFRVLLPLSQPHSA